MSPPQPDSEEWRLINIDHKQLSLECNYEGQIASWFFMSESQQPYLFWSLYLPCLPPNYDAQCASPAPQPSPLFKLPAELIGMLFDAINMLGLGLHTTIALAITCKHMLSVGKPHVLRATRAHWAPWAGCRLICVGSETLPGDLPPGMLTIQEEQAIGTWGEKEAMMKADNTSHAIEERSDQDSAEEDADEGWGVRRPTLPNYVRSHYRLVFGGWWEWRRTDAGQTLHHAITMEHIAHPFLDHLLGDARRFAALYPQTSSAPAYPAGLRILCNLSAKEYVREDALQLGRAHGRENGASWAHVLLSRICWSSHPSTGLDGERAKMLRRGPWAGGRFCITTLESLPEAMAAFGLNVGEVGEWRDVSAEVDEVLQDLLDCISPHDGGLRGHAKAGPWTIGWRKDS